MLAFVWRRRWGWQWLAGWTTILVAEITVLRSFTLSWELPSVLFGIVVVAAGLCVVTSGAVIWRAWQSNVAETALLGSFFMAVSLLPLAHGLTVPGVLYGPNTATIAAVFWAVPAGSLVLIPYVAPRAAWTNRLMRNWHRWVSAHLVLLSACFIVMLAYPTAIPVPALGSTGAIVGVVFSVSVCVALSYRHLRLAGIARASGPLATSTGAALVGASTLVFLGTAPWTPGFWLAHVLDITGVFAATIGGAVVYRRTKSVAIVLAPVEATTPLRALDLSLDPVVHHFVAALDQKDPITRDHVVRTAHMAALVAEATAVPFEQLSTITLGALLHDVGKLLVPDSVLNKPGRLDPDEYELVQRHVVDGEAIVLASGALDDIAPIVRGHHERIDGGGYPDGLQGGAIPIGARIVAVCDAYDAMAHTRKYRVGMGQDRALAVLSEHAGSQWDPTVVDSLTTIVRRRGTDFDGDALANVGRHSSAPDTTAWCGCADALPADLVSNPG